MKNLIIVANWKSNKNKSEALSFLNDFKSVYKKSANKEVVICPSFPYLSLLSDYIKENNLDLKLGAQNVSHFQDGPFTGEVNARQLRDFVSYCIVGHSERRQEFSEEATVINDKIKRLKEEEIMPIVCLSDARDLDLLKIDGCIAMFEPPSAISTNSGEAEDINIVEEFTMKIKSLGSKAFYGGSVDENNIKHFTNIESVDGVLIGGASLDPIKFAQIINNA